MSSKMREALSEIIDLIDKWRADGEMEHWQCSSLFGIADAALAQPLRNCDVGTPEEQQDRFADFCGKHECTINCPIKKKWRGHNPSCGILWEQMPYESEVK